MELSEGLIIYTESEEGSKEGSKNTEILPPRL